MIELGISYEILFVLLVLCIAVFLILSIVKFVLLVLNRNKKPIILSKPISKFLKYYSKLLKYSFRVFYVLLFMFIIYCIYDLTWVPHIVSKYPTDNQIMSSVNRNIEVIFNRPINPDTIKPYVHPEIKGKWKLEPTDNTFSFIKRRLVFEAEESFPVNQKIFIYVAGVGNTIRLNELWEFGTDSTTPETFVNISSEPANGAQDIPISNSKLNIILDQPAGDYYEWDMTVEPSVPFTMKKDISNIYFTFNGNLNQGVVYNYKLFSTPVRYKLPSMEILERGDKKEIYSGNFKTVTQPMISSIEPQGTKVLPKSQIKITFDQPMNEKSVIESFTIDPPVTGSFISIDNTTFNLQNEALAKDTKYDLVLKQGMQNLKGGFLESNYNYSFKTLGAINIDGVNPNNNSYGIDINSNILVTFDQNVNHASAESKFGISPSLNGNFSWDENTMIFNPNNSFGYDSKYSFHLDSGIVSIDGSDSNRQFNYSFTTQEETFSLNVPVYWQKLRFSCNLEATRMALAYRGVYKDVMTLYNQIQKDTTPYDEVANTFGDPYSGYVGDIYGKTKGYGVYWGPISNLISNYRSNSIKTGWNLTGLLTEVRNGNPVIVWAHNGYSYAGTEYHWTTPGGKYIRAITGMHSYVVVGYVGPIGNPRKVIVNDSNRGRWTLNKDYFMGLWGYFNNTGIVVY